MVSQSKVVKQGTNKDLKQMEQAQMGSRAIENPSAYLNREIGGLLIRIS